MIVVSACLANIKCRYDGDCSTNKYIKELVENGQAIPVCPEVLGGLTIPRDKSEIVQENGEIKVITDKGNDVTKAFELGANRTLAIARAINAKKAILKSKSPSCGCHKIYDGTFSGQLIDGMGITARLLHENGIEVINEKELEVIK